MQAASFLVGTPVSDPDRFFGRERECKRLFGLLSQLPLQNALIIGPKRSGKTSLLYYLQNRLLRRPGYRFVFVDFLDPRLRTREGLLRHLFTGIGWPRDKTAEVDLPAFSDHLSTHLEEPTVLLFDEIGAALTDPRGELDDPFWEGLRSLATNYARGLLAFILSSHLPPKELARSTGHSSPFFNIFGYVARLGPFTEAEARALIASSPRHFPMDDVEWILQQSERWPHLLQILCRERLNSLDDGPDDRIWRNEGLFQMQGFRHLLDGDATPPTTPMVPRKLTFASLRKLIDAVLIGDSDLDAFCLDHFKLIKQKFTAGMDRVAKVNLLLEQVDRSEILKWLRQDYPKPVADNERKLSYE